MGSVRRRVREASSELEGGARMLRCDGACVTSYSSAGERAVHARARWTFSDGANGWAPEAVG